MGLSVLDCLYICMYLILISEGIPTYKKISDIRKDKIKFFNLTICFLCSHVAFIFIFVRLIA